MRESEKKRELLKASLQQVLLMIKIKMSLQSVAWDLYTTQATKITKRYELVTITWGRIWEEQNLEPKRSTKAVENSQAANSQKLQKFTTLAKLPRCKLHSVQLLFLQFLICSSKFNLNSS